MKMKKTAIILSIMLIVTPAFVPSLQAASSNEAANMLVEVGNTAYHNGDVRLAVHEWSKALMLDHDHAEARDNLARLGIDSGLYTGAQTYETRLADLARKIEGYEAKVAELEKQKHILEVKFQTLQVENNGLLKDRKSLRAERATQQEQVAMLKKEVTATEQEKFNSLQELKRQYNDETEILKAAMSERREETIDKQLDFLARAEAKHAFYTSRYEEIASALSQEKAMADLLSRYGRAQEALNQYKANDDNLFKVVEDYLYVRRSEVENLKDELLFAEIALTESQLSLLTKLDELLKSHDDQGELRRSIDERDDLIRTLNAE